MSKFLTIPDSPNYEINSKGVCRNKKTGRVIKPQKKGNSIVMHITPLHGKAIMRSPKTLWLQAKDAAENSSFEPIPSAAGLYEIDKFGHVRNAKTKRHVICFDNCVRLHINGQSKNFSIQSLMWEVFGKLPDSTKGKPIPCSAENDSGKFFFNSLADCAKFLAPKIFLHWNSIRRYYFVRRVPEVHGWKITYLPPDLSHVQYDGRILNSVARHMKRADQSLGRNGLVDTAHLW